MMTRQFQQLILSNDLILRNIFSFLDPEDIKTAMLVCRLDYVHDKTKHQTDSGNIEIAFRRWKEELEIKEFWNKTYIVVLVLSSKEYDPQEYSSNPVKSKPFVTSYPINGV